MSTLTVTTVNTANTTTDLTMKTGNTSSTGMVISSANDYVGIGTTTPGSKLHILSSTSAATQGIRIGVTGAINGSYGVINHNASGTADYGLQLMHYNGANNDAAVVVGGANQLNNTYVYSNGTIITVTYPSGFNIASGNLFIAGKQWSAGPAFHAYLSAAQTQTSGTEVKVNLNAEVYDTASCFDTTTNYRFTPNVAGYYVFIGRVKPNLTTATQMGADIYKNGASLSQGSWGASVSNIASYGAAITYMNGTTDYVELYCYQSGSSNIGTGADNTFLVGCLLRSA